MHMQELVNSPDANYMVLEEYETEGFVVQILPNKHPEYRVYLLIIENNKGIFSGGEVSVYNARSWAADIIERIQKERGYR